MVMIMNYAKFDGTDVVQKPDELGLPLPWPFPKNLEKLTGTLTEFKAVLSKGPFEDRFYVRLAALTQGKDVGLTQEEVSAVMLGVTGHGVAAFTSFNEGPQLQPAMYIFAELDGKPLRGWLEYCEFTAGDEVEIVAEWAGEYYEVYAITRPKDEVITVYPECRNGTTASRISVLTGYLLFSSVLWLLGFLLISLFFIGKYGINEYVAEDWKQIAYICFLVSFGVMGSIAGIKAYWSNKKTQVVLAEHIFKALGWQNVKNISLDFMTMKKSREYKKKGVEITGWKFENYRNSDPLYKYNSGGISYHYYTDVVYGRKRR